MKWFIRLIIQLLILTIFFIFRELQKTPEDAKGIPNFWLTIFRNTELLSEMVQEHDEPVLKKLTDIKIVYDNEVSVI